MPNYVFTYRRPQQDAPAGTPEEWMGWLGAISDNVVEIGQPTGDTRRIGGGNLGDAVSGYSIISADSLDHAASLAEGCPVVKLGYGLEIGELVEINAAV